MEAVLWKYGPALCVCVCVCVGLRTCVCVPQELQHSILSLSTKILVGCDEAVETLQQVTTALINSDIPDRETRSEPTSHLAPHNTPSPNTPAPRVSLSPPTSSPLLSGHLANFKAQLKI